MESCGSNRLRVENLLCVSKELRGPKDEKNEKMFYLREGEAISNFKEEKNQMT
jgi:hypothetical protein